jgi:hypothetical protein
MKGWVDGQGAVPSLMVSSRMSTRPPTPPDALQQNYRAKRPRAINARPVARQQTTQSTLHNAAWLHDIVWACSGLLEFGRRST